MPESVRDASPQTIETEVVVLGGGPSGLTLALELGLHGVACVVVEPRRTVADNRPRAKTTSARTMELFRRLGVADDVRAAAALPLGWSDRITFCATVTGAEITHVDQAFGLDLGGSTLVAEAGQQVSQPVIERVLRRHVDASAGATLMLGWHGVSAEDTGAQVLVTVEDESGDRRRIVASQLVGADGPRSLVRRALGARYEGAAAGRPNVNITFRSQRLAAAIPHPPSVHYWVLNPASPGVVGPLDLDGTWWAISTGTAAVEDDAHAERLVRDLIGRPGVDLDLDVQIVATDPWQARMLLADCYGRGRMHMVGDAAHQNPPWGGHGFNTGVGDAVNLGWKLAAVLRGWASAALLESYQSERRPVAQQTIAVAIGNMGTLSSDLTDPALMASGAAFEAARQRAAAVVQQTKDAEFHSLGLVLGAGYTAEARSQAPTVADYRPAAVPGARLPHGRDSSGRSIFDLLGSDLSLVGPAEASDGFGRAASSRGIPLRSIGALPHLGNDLVLVRPDQVIAWVGRPGDDPERALDAAVTGFGPDMP